MTPRDEMAADVLADRDDDLGDELADREGHHHNRPRIASAPQRMIVVTFTNPEAAQAWDSAGQPVGDLASQAVA